LIVKNMLDLKRTRFLLSDFNDAAAFMSSTSPNAVGAW
jgi:hypothetical protein